MIFIAMINYFVIASSNTVLDIAKDFTALIIIAEFDDIFGSGMEDELARKVCLDEDTIYEDLFVIETTTSRDAKTKMNMKIRDDPVYDKIN